jgi:hypothetical protein
MSSSKPHSLSPDALGRAEEVAAEVEVPEVAAVETEAGATEVGATAAGATAATAADAAVPWTPEPRSASAARRPA